MFRVPPRMVKIPLLVFLGCLLAGLGYSATRPEIFQANARVWVQSKRPPDVIGGQASESVYTPLTQYFNSPIVTASEVLRSNLVINQAFEILQAEHLRHIPTPNEIRDGLSVLPGKDSDVLLVSYRSGHRDNVAPVLQAVLDGFIKVNNTQSAGTATQSRISLEKQLETLKGDYRQARERLRNYQDSNNAVDLDSQVKAILQRITDLQNESARARREASAARGKVEYLKGQLGLDPHQALAIERMSQDEVLKGLKQKLAEDQVALIDARTKYREAHPHIQQLQKSIEKINQAVAARLTALLGANGVHLANADADTATHDPLREQMLSELVQAQSEQLAAESGLASLDGLIETQQGQLKEIPLHQDKVARLARAEQVAGETLSEAEKKLQAIKVVESVAYNSSNVQIIDMPETPHFPVSPNRLSDALMSILLGLAGAAATFVGMWISDPRLRRAEDAVVMLSLPIVGWLPDLVANAKQIHGIATMSRAHVNMSGLLKPDQRYIVVTSPDKGDGKTTVAASLALAFAAAGRKVLLVDADFVNPQLEKLFNVTNAPGLRDYLESPEPQTALSVVRNIGKNLQFVPAGTGLSDHKLLVVTKTLDQLLAHIRSDAEVVVIDTAAVGESAASLALLGALSHLLIVVRLGHTFKHSMQQLASQLQLRHYDNGCMIVTDASEQDMPQLTEFETTPAADRAEQSAW